MKHKQKSFKKLAQVKRCTWEKNQEESHILGSFFEHSFHVNYYWVSEEEQKWKHKSKLTLASPGLQSNTVLRDCKEWIMHCSNWDGWKSNELLVVDKHIKYTLHKYIKT